MMMMTMMIMMMMMMMTMMIMMMMMLRMAEEFGWQGPRVMEGPLVRDASYSRQPPRPTVPPSPPAAGKKLRHFGQKKDSRTAARSTQWICAA